MSKGIRQTISARQARAGARPGSTVQPRTTTAPAPVQQQDKRLAQIVDQGGVGVWKVKGNDAPIYALSREQAQDEAQRRGVKGELSLAGYVKLSDADRAKLQQAASASKAGAARSAAGSRTPSYRELMQTKGYDKETALRIASQMKESERRQRIGKNESADIGTPAPKAFTDEEKAWIESRGGKVGVVSEAEAARAEAGSDSNAMGYVQRPRDEREERVAVSEAAYKSAAAAIQPYIKEVPWRHTVVREFDSIKFVDDLGSDKAFIALQNFGYSTTEARRIVQSAREQKSVRETLKPYTDQYGRVDVVGALRAGIPQPTLTKAGFDDRTVNDAAYWAATLREMPEWKGSGREPTSDVSYWTGATIGGPPGQEVLLRDTWEWMVRQKMEPYRVPGETNLYDIGRALDEGKIDAKFIRQAGFTWPEMLTAATATKPEERCCAVYTGQTGVQQADPKRMQDSIMLHLADMPDKAPLIAPGLARFQETLDRTTQGKHPLVRVPAALAAGMSFALMPLAIAEDLMFTPGLAQKGQKVTEYATGSVRYFTTLPVSFMNDPYWTTGEVAGMVLGPQAAIRVAKTARVWVDPYGVPARTVGIEWSTGRVPVSQMSAAQKVAVGKALAEAQRQIMQGKLSGTVKAGTVQLQYRGTPLQHTVGDVVFHGTPDVTKFQKGTVRVAEGQPLYTSTYLTPRFIAATAAGKVGARPGAVAILTDASKIRTAPGAQLAKGATTETFIVGAKPGLYGPSKLYKGAFETEIVAAPTSTFRPAPGNLRTRILGEAAGQFFVQYTGPTVGKLRSGDLVPVTVLLDKGVYRTPPSPSALYAAKLLTVWESLKDMGAKAVHPLRSLREMQLQRMTAEQKVAALAAEMQKEAAAAAGARATNSTRERALADAYGERVRTMYESARGVGEMLYARQSARFEQSYTRYLGDHLRAAARVYTAAESYATVRDSRGNLPEVPVRSLPRELREERERVLPREESVSTRGVRAEPRRAVPTQERVIETTPVGGGTPRHTPRRVPVKPTDDDDTRRRKAGALLQEQQHRMEDPGRVQWRQGAYWIMVEPPPKEGERQRNVQYSRRPFWGVRKVKGNPEETFAKQGKPPREFLYEMGVTKARIFSYEKPHLRWRQTGAATRRRRRGKVI